MVAVAVAVAIAVMRRLVNETKGGVGRWEVLMVHYHFCVMRCLRPRIGMKMIFTIILNASHSDGTRISGYGRHYETDDDLWGPSNKDHSREVYCELICKG